MRLTDALDQFLAWREVERDATPRSLESYRRILEKVDEEHPNALLSDFDGRPGTDKLRSLIARRWGGRSAGTRKNVIAVIRSFFEWAESEDLIEDNPARRIKPPPVRNAAVYRPTVDELWRIRKAATGHERGPILLMLGVGLRAEEVCRVRWQDVDLDQGRVKVLRKGRKWQRLPIEEDVREELEALRDELDPDPEWHVFMLEVERWVDQWNRERGFLDPFSPGTTRSLWRLVRRVCKRAGVTEVGPHALRHGYATQLVRDGAPLEAVQWLLGHTRPDTTQRYLDELKIEEVEETLRSVRGKVPTPARATADTHVPNRSGSMPLGKWRRRESNPRSQFHG